MDPLFGVPFATPNPCGGDASTDCFDEFHPQSRPSHEVELHIDIPGVLFALAGQGGLSDETTASLNEAVADGEFEPDDLHNPNSNVTVPTPGGDVTLSVTEIAQLLVDTTGFHFDPAGIHVEPGDVVLFSAETPDHAVSAYHERHGRQNRVPDDVGPFSSPLIPVGGGWLFEFDEPGVYDCYCPPHEPFGMILRVVVHDDGSVPSPSIEQTGRPPEDENLLSFALAGLDPNVPSAAEALETEALEPETIVDDGRVSWHHVVEEHRANS